MLFILAPNAFLCSCEGIALIFVTCVSDLHEWLLPSKDITYADETDTSVTGVNVEEEKRKPEQDVINVLRFMASNGLIDHASKTAFLLINNNKEENKINSWKI